VEQVGVVVVVVKISIILLHFKGSGRLRQALDFALAVRSSWCGWLIVESGSTGNCASIDGSLLLWSGPNVLDGGVANVTLPQQM
jgi:hypothetical protein